jgi:hypothetical protein
VGTRGWRDGVNMVRKIEKATDRPLETPYVQQC